MKKKLLLSTLCMVTLLTLLNTQIAFGQKVMDPNDPIIEYDSTHKPAFPGYGLIGDWVRTKHPAITWNTSMYKSYFYGNQYGMPFRLHFPKNYNPNVDDGKKYPLILFWHGNGESGDKTVDKNGNSTYPYGNEHHLIHGHETVFNDAIENGTFDGFILSPQVKGLIFKTNIDAMVNLIKLMIKDYKVDPFHIIVNGLSDGGKASWESISLYPNIFAANIAMSWSQTNYAKFSYVDNIKYSPTWVSQGGQDINPYPWITQMVKDTMLKYGANFKESYYPNNGHWTWYDMWGNRDFWPFVNRTYSSNPWPLFGKTNFWPGEPINVTIGIVQGFDAYEWRRNGTQLVGSTSNEIHITGPGVYDARVMRDGMWSDWSHVPVTITGDSYRIQAEDWVNMSGVLTEVTADVDGNVNVGWINNADWMDYTIAPYVPGVYTLKLRVASPSNGGKLEIRNSDSTVLATVNLPLTSGWQSWTTVSVDLPLSAGSQNIRIKSISENGWNINWLEFTGKTLESPLPVNFTLFNAQCNNGVTNLLWKTAQEQNSQRFSIQKNKAGAGWKEIASLPAAGQSSTERSYHYSDNKAAAGDLYRIVEYDFDGKSTFSTIIKGNCDSKNEVTLFPNPTGGDAVLNLYLQRSAKVAMWIYDSKGALMSQQLQTLPAGNSSLPVNTAHFAKGIYTVKLSYNGEVKTLQLLKK
jgi:predicted esterase